MLEIPACDRHCSSGDGGVGGFYGKDDVCHF